VTVYIERFFRIIFDIIFLMKFLYLPKLSKDRTPYMDGMVKVYRALPKAAGADRIYLAGEVEQESEKQRRSDGTPLSPAVVTSLLELAKEPDIEYHL